MSEKQQIPIEQILQSLNENFPGTVLDSVTNSDIFTIRVEAVAAHGIISFLKEKPELNFYFLTTLCGIHFPDDPLPFGVVYHLHNFERNTRIIIKVFLPGDKPEIKSIVDIFMAANWMEREAYDFYGIIFSGHPNLKRILNVEYLDYFPLRKEYPLEDPTREDKNNNFFGR